MKRYLLLASVAGCLLSAGNAWADGGWSETEPSTTLNISAKIEPGAWGKVDDMNWGTFVLDTATDVGAEIATFSDGTVSYNSDAVWANSGDAEAGVIGVSSGATRITGVSFNPTTVDLVDSEDQVIAQVTDLAVHGDITDGGDLYLDATLIRGEGTLPYDGEVEITGSTTVTLSF